MGDGPDVLLSGSKQDAIYENAMTIKIFEFILTTDKETIN